MNDDLRLNIEILQDHRLAQIMSSKSFIFTVRSQNDAHDYNFNVRLGNMDLIKSNLEVIMRSFQPSTKYYKALEEIYRASRNGVTDIFYAVKDGSSLVFAFKQAGELVFDSLVG